MDECEGCGLCFLKFQQYQRAKMPSMGIAATELFDGAKKTESD